MVIEQHEDLIENTHDVHGAELGRQAREAHDVREEDGDLPVQRSNTLRIY